MAEHDSRKHPRDRLKRELSLNDASMLIVASVIGSGIFLTPGRVAELIPNVNFILLAWLFGGLLSLAGAFANAELGAMYPRAGGDYVYLREAFHPLAGFLVGWFTFFAIFTGTVATLAVALAEALSGLVPPIAGTEVYWAVLFVIATSAINYFALRWGTRFNNVISYVKIVALLAFCALGPLIGEGRLQNLYSAVSDTKTLSISAFILALSPILFTYLGWNAPVYTASEIRDPGRNLPASLLLGLVICTVIYLLMNIVYLYAIPLQVLGGVVNVGDTAAHALFGSVAGRLVGLFVLLSILGSLSATVLVGPRIIYAMALDGLFFRGTDRVHERYGTPHRAILIQALVAIPLILFLQKFSSILDFTVFGIVFATIADVLALYALRRRKPNLLRPYRTWGYPWVPALYLLANLAIAAVLILERPKECFLALSFFVIGVPVYWYFNTGQE